MPKRAQKKRIQRAHDRWLKEESGQSEEKSGGQYYVLLWPDMKKVKGLNRKQAYELWSNHHDRAMIFSMEDDIKRG